MIAYTLKEDTTVTSSATTFVCNSTYTPTAYYEHYSCNAHEGLDLGTKLKKVKKSFIDYKLAFKRLPFPKINTLSKPKHFSNRKLVRRCKSYGFLKNLRSLV